MGDFPSHLVRAPDRPRYGRLKATVIGVSTLTMCLVLAGAAPARVIRPAAFSIAGMNAIGAPPAGTSWAPEPVVAHGLRINATAGSGEFALHTAGGDRTFLPGVDLGSTTPGHQPGELSITAAQYRSWFAAMGWLGIRVVRIYTIHPPAFYRELARYDRADPDRPLYLMQGVYFPDESYGETAFQAELKDASAAVSGDLSRAPRRGRAGGAWDTDVTPWLAGWIVGAGVSDRRNAGANAATGQYFRSTKAATPTERWLAKRMDELATYEAARGRSDPIAFVNLPATDPLRHPDEPLAEGVDANHVQPTSAWPAGTFASYHAYPYYPDFLRHEPALLAYRYAGRSDPYAGYLAALRKHHGAMPVLVTEFGVPSSIGSAHNGPLGRSQGDHGEREAMRIDAGLLRLIRDQGLSGGFLAGWTDEWFTSTWNTAGHQDAERRQLWHDPLTAGQHVGLVAMDAAGSPDAVDQYLVDSEHAWPARRIIARVDESYVRLTVVLGTSRPGVLTLGFDVLPGLYGPPAPGAGDRAADASFTLDLVSHTGQAYLRDELDPLPLDWPVPAAERGPAPIGWKRFELVVDRGLPAELQAAGALRYGTWDADSRNLWHLNDDDLIVRVPWALLGYADPSSHRVGVRSGRTLTTQVSPGVAVTVSASGTDQPTGNVTWVNWNRPYYTERLKQGAGQFRDAALDVTRPE